MRIVIIALHQNYYYPKLIGKHIDLQDNAPHTNEEYAFHKFESDRGDIAWAYVHKKLCQIIDEHE